MQLHIDTKKGLFTCDGEEVDIYSPKGFEIVSSLWLRLAWNGRYPYTMTWLGQPIFQLPEDIVRLQEVVYQLKPDYIIETGVAFGGSLLLHATTCRIVGQGHVIGIEKHVRPRNREALQRHPLADLITVIEGDSIDKAIVQRVRDMVPKGVRVLVILDSAHTKRHVLAELEAYAPLVSVGSYAVVTDGFIGEMAEAPNGKAYWREDNPLSAVEAFLSHNSHFVAEAPVWPYNDTELTTALSFLGGGWLKRMS
jgi:cephalosporin hydroxylase